MAETNNKNQAVADKAAAEEAKAADKAAADKAAAVVDELDDRKLYRLDVTKHPQGGNGKRLIIGHRAKKFITNGYATLVIEKKTKK